jgi:hypothetical protein
LYFSGVILENGSEETLGLENSCNPEASGLSLVHPFIDKSESIYQILDPRG